MKSQPTLDWDNVRCFLAVVQRGSLSAGAREIGISVATAGRRIDSLEQQLGVSVLHRGAAGVRLTPEGDRVLRHARAGGEHLDQLERLAKASRLSAAETPVVVSATEPMVTHVLAPRLSQLLDTDPAVRVDLRVSTTQVNLNRGEADLAIRLARPTLDSLYARRLPNIEMGMYATRGYLAGRQPADIKLAQERLLAFDHSYGDIPEVRWLEQQGLVSAVWMSSSSTSALLAAACAGVGVAMLPRFLAEPSGLVRLPARAIAPRVPWIVYHRDARKVPRIVRIR